MAIELYALISQRKLRSNLRHEFVERNGRTNVRTNRNKRCYPYWANFLNNQHHSLLKTNVFKLLVIDDHPITARGLRWLFSSQPRTTQVYIANSIDDAIGLLRNDSFEEFLVLLDLGLPGVNDLEGFDYLRAIFPGLKVAIYSGFDNREIMLRAMRKQASGFIPKATSPESVVNAVFLMMDGGVYLPPELLSAMNYSPEQIVSSEQTKRVQRLIASMPPRRHEVLSLLAKGQANKEICRELQMGLNTVKTHIALIFATFEVHSRHELSALLQESLRK